MTHEYKNDRNNIGACVVVVNGNGKVLLGVRKNSYKSGMYGIPGGRVERVELIESTAKRELFEETGIEAERLEYVGVVREVQEHGNFIHFVYSVEVEDQQPKLMEPDKCDGWEWKNVESLENVLPGHKAAIELWTSQMKIIDLPVF